MSELTHILQALDDGGAADKLLPLVYDELRHLAAQRLAHEKPGQTLQPTALVHEAYLRLIGPANAAGFANRRHFFAAAAEAMRRLLVEQARRKHGPRRGGHLRRADVDLDLLPAGAPAPDLLALDEALARLAQEAPARAELVKLRFFAGMTLPEAAEVLNVSLATAERYWTYARTWLFAELRPDDSPENNP